MEVVERSEGRWLVESRTEGWRHVKRIGESTFLCDCPWGLFGKGKDCAHVEAVKSK